MITADIESNPIYCPTMGPKADPNWRYTDAAGHEHYYSTDVPLSNGRPYPTLFRVVDEVEYIDGDEVELTHLECSRCGEWIVPGSIPGPHEEYIRGMVSAEVTLAWSDPFDDPPGPPDRVDVTAVRYEMGRTTYTWKYHVSGEAAYYAKVLHDREGEAAAKEYLDALRFGTVWRGVDMAVAMDHAVMRPVVWRAQ